jgi:hypothetical protein
MYLERTYRKVPDFKEYIKLMTVPKFKYNMKKVACLLPPKQRTVSRFINMSQRVEWSSKMLSAYNTLQDDEREVFSFIPASAPYSLSKSCLSGRLSVSCFSAGR